MQTALWYSVLPIRLTYTETIFKREFDKSVEEKSLGLFGWIKRIIWIGLIKKLCQKQIVQGNQNEWILCIILWFQQPDSQYETEFKKEKCIWDNCNCLVHQQTDYNISKGGRRRYPIQIQFLRERDRWKGIARTRADEWLLWRQSIAILIFQLIICNCWNKSWKSVIAQFVQYMDFLSCFCSAWKDPAWNRRGFDFYFVDAALITVRYLSFPLHVTNKPLPLICIIYTLQKVLFMSWWLCFFCITMCIWKRR